MHKVHFKLFSEIGINNFFDQIKNQLQRDIELLPNNSFIESKEEEIISEIYKKYIIGLPKIDIDKIQKEAYENEIGSEDFPISPRFDVMPGKKYLVQVAIYKIPFEGNGTVFRLKSTKSILWTEECYFEGNNLICFEIPNFTRNADDVKNDFKKKKDFLLKQYVNV